MQYTEYIKVFIHHKTRNLSVNKVHRANFDCMHLKVIFKMLHVDYMLLPSLLGSKHS